MPAKSHCFKASTLLSARLNDAYRQSGKKPNVWLKEAALAKLAAEHEPPLPPLLPTANGLFGRPANDGGEG